MLDGIEVLCHSSIRFDKGIVMYFDPFKIEKNYSDADIVFITHDHYDHYSLEDIRKVIKKDTMLVLPTSLLEKALHDGFETDNIVIVEPNKNYNVNGIKFSTVPSYNVNKQFHPKENNWVGYLIEMDDLTYYIAGDTDITEENKQVKCNVAFVPVGGVYTMTYEEAAKLINEIRPKVAVPIHYGSIVGTKEDGLNFSKLIYPKVECKIFI